MHEKAEKSPRIADYDSVGYDYETYWEGIEYEDIADKAALYSLLQKAKHKITADTVYIDIGGSYGREVPILQKYFKHVIVFDYSLQSLIKGKKQIDKNGNGNTVYWVAGNVYHLPFRDSSVQAGQMVRVMHHLKETSIAFSEIDRVISQFFVLEYANKLNAKHIVSWTLNGKLSLLMDPHPYQQQFRETSQGSKGNNQIFLNFSPRYIAEKIEATHFKITRALSVSNLRSPGLKKIFSPEFLAKVESVLQEPLASFNFGPSMYILLEKMQTKKTHRMESLESILCCPKCRETLVFDAEKMSCLACSLNFGITDGVYDLRYSSETA